MRLRASVAKRRTRRQQSESPKRKLITCRRSLNNAAQLTGDDRGTTTQTNSVEAFSCFNPDHLQQFHVE
ncbi:hypothetical protein Bca4012_072899 [Brassica carinata]